MRFLRKIIIAFILNLTQLIIASAFKHIAFIALIELHSFLLTGLLLNYKTQFLLMAVLPRMLMWFCYFFSVVVNLCLGGKRDLSYF